MKRKWLFFFNSILISLFFNINVSFSDEAFVYPANGQPPQQITQDKLECQEWAKQQTGFDPMTGNQTANPNTGQTSGGAVKGAARGALVGVAVGAIAGNAGKGAAIGAASGGLIGGMRQRDQVQRQQQAYQQQANENAQLRSNYNRAYKTCLSGRGYTVN